MRDMPEILSRLQIRIVGAGYALGVVISALLISWRYLQFLRDPQDASGGMSAFGDLALAIFIGFLFLVPTLGLIWVIRKSESASLIFAKVMLGWSLTAPLSLGLSMVPFLNHGYWGEVILFRWFAIPVLVLVLALSWWLARFVRARRLIVYAALIEGVTFAAALVSFFLPLKGRG